MQDTWTDRYLEHLGMTRREPSGDYLQALVERHLERVPFEVIGKYHYYSTRPKDDLIPPKELFLDNLIRKGWGGNCYILNSHFGDLLRSLGFETALVRARGGNAHLALMVNVEGKACYVDVGYGAPLFEPLLLDSEPHLVRCGEEIIVRKSNEREYVIDRRTGGQSFVVKTIDWTPVGLERFRDDFIYAHRDEDDNPFMRRIVATIYRNRVCYQVINGKLLVKSDTNIEITEYTDESEWKKMMSSMFNLDEESIDFALSFLAGRNVHLFST